jgi:hypothetical protein
VNLPRLATATGAAGRATARAASPWPDAWSGARAVPPRHLAIAATLAVAWGGVNALGWWLGSGSADPVRMAAYFTYEALLPMLLLACALAAADAVTRDAPDRVMPYAAGAIAAALAGEAVFRATSPWLGLGACACSMDAWPAGARTANMLPDSLLVCGFVTAGYRYWRRAAQRTARANAAELEHARVMRQTQESRLQAMQACIEPQFLFETLGDVDRLHAADARTAVRLLDDLIVYLRAALPHLKESTSTVAKEAELATAYLNIQRLRRGGRPAFRIDVAADAHDARMPPMLLLPLIGHAAAPGEAAAPTLDPLTIRIEVAGGLLRMTLRAGAAAFAPDGPGGAIVAGVRDRLHDLYAGAARVAVDEDQRGITMEFPHERPGRDPR